MIKNKITVFLQVDQQTNFNSYLQSLSNVLSQNQPGKDVTVDIITITTSQVHPDVKKMYEDIEDIKSRYKNWPEYFELKCVFSDDNTFNKIRNVTDIIMKDQIGELITFKSVAPIFWYPNHLKTHWETYKVNKKTGFMLSKIELKDLSKGSNEKENTFNYRLDDFPKHIDQIIIDELFLVNQVCTAVDFNKAAVEQVINQNGKDIKYAIFHVGKLVTDEIIPVSNELELKAFNPDEITIIQWIDVAAIKKQRDEAMKQQEEDIKTKENEDGSVEFTEEVGEDGATLFTED